MKKGITQVIAVLMLPVLCIAMTGCRYKNSPKQTTESEILEQSDGDVVMLNQPLAPEIKTGPGSDKNEDEVDAYYKWRMEFIAGTNLDAYRDGIREFSNRTAAGVFQCIAGNKLSENVAYSPASIYLTTLMLQRCAAGDTREKILKFLNLESEEQAKDAANSLYRRLCFVNGDHALMFANSMWLNKDMLGEFNQETADALSRDYMASVWAGKMGKPVDAAAMEWMKRETHNMIGIEPGTDKSTVSMLINALYYKDSWIDPFEPDLTDTAKFTNADGTEIVTDMMHQTRDGFVFHGKDYDLASLPSRKGEMRFILPREGVNPMELLSSEDVLAELISADLESKSKDYEVLWDMPKFDASSNLDLTEPLMDRGLGDVGNDYSALSTQINMVLSKIQQLNRVKVDEQGFEAAAVTIMMWIGGALQDEKEQFMMKLDRPFAFVILSDGIPLFIGAVNSMF